MTTAATAVDLADEQWFPAELDIHSRQYGMLRISESIVEASAFMDNRLAADLTSLVPCPLVAAAEIETHCQASWLFHTSFCCSTLLARALHIQPRVVVLKEPLVLRRLSDAKVEQVPFHEYLRPTINLLFRPWAVDGRVIVKPTHAALNIACDLLTASPTSRAVALTSSLDDFLISNIKKTKETQAKIPILVERAFSASSMQYRMPKKIIDPPSILAAAGLQWAVQRELLLDIAEHAQGRVFFLDSSLLLGAGVAKAVRACFDWWGIEASDEEVSARVDHVVTVNAKETSKPYSATARAEEMVWLSREYASELSLAKRWLENEILPYVRPKAVELGFS